MSPRTNRARPPLVLLASDREPAAGEIEQVLSRHGYTVFRAHTGRIALQATRSTEPEAVLVDDVLPDTDGFSLCTQMRDDPEVGPSRPVLMILNNPPSPAEHRSAMRAGVWEFVVEPIQPDELTSRLDRHILTSLESQLTPTRTLTDIGGLYTPEGLAHRARELAILAFHHHAGMACVVMSPERSQDVDRVGNHLKHVTRRSDALGRLSPSAFAIVAPGTDSKGAVLLAQRVAGELRKESEEPPELRAGYDAIPSIRRAGLEPRHMLDRAAVALQRVLESRKGEWIRGYD